MPHVALGGDGRVRRGRVENRLARIPGQVVHGQVRQVRQAVAIHDLIERTRVAVIAVHALAQGGGEDEVGVADEKDVRHRRGDGRGGGHGGPGGAVIGGELDAVLLGADEEGPRRVVVGHVVDVEVRVVDLAPGPEARSAGLGAAQEAAAVRGEEDQAGGGRAVGLLHGDVVDEVHARRGGGAVHQVRKGIEDLGEGGPLVHVGPAAPGSEEEVMGKGARGRVGIDGQALDVLVHRGHAAGGVRHRESAWIDVKAAVPGGRVPVGAVPKEIGVVITGPGEGRAGRERVLGKVHSVVRAVIRVTQVPTGVSTAGRTRVHVPGGLNAHRHHLGGERCRRRLLHPDVLGEGRNGERQQGDHQADPHEPRSQRFVHPQPPIPSLKALQPHGVSCRNKPEWITSRGGPTAAPPPSPLGPLRVHVAPALRVRPPELLRRTGCPRIPKAPAHRQAPAHPPPFNPPSRPKKTSKCGPLPLRRKYIRAICGVNTLPPGGMASCPLLFALSLL